MYKRQYFDCALALREVRTIGTCAPSTMPTCCEPARYRRPLFRMLPVSYTHLRYLWPTRKFDSVDGLRQMVQQAAAAALESWQDVYKRQVQG